MISDDGVVGEESIWIKQKYVYGRTSWNSGGGPYNVRDGRGERNGLNVSRGQQLASSFLLPNSALMPIVQKVFQFRSLRN